MEIIGDFKDSRITTLRQLNLGQLNALLNGIGKARGDMITLLHSDDSLSDNNALERNVKALVKEQNEGLFADLITIGESGDVTGKIEVADSIDQSSPSRLLLNGGSNMIPDPFFIKRSALNNIVTTYILWNMPYWIVFGGKQIGVLRLSKIHPWYKYRVYSQNIASSEIGKFEELNGRLRTIIEISKLIDVRFLHFQRKFNMYVRKITGFQPYPIHSTGMSSWNDIREIILSTVGSYDNNIKQNFYLKSIIGYFTNSPSQRSIRLGPLENVRNLFGKDARIFYRLMEQRSLPRV